MVFFIPRTPRKKSNTNVYHVIIRGINRQNLFFDKQDWIKYIKEIKKTKEVYKYEIYAYVLMPNHVHFIIHDKFNNLSTMIQSLNVRYSNYFNKKYERVGHLFENRFKSKNIEEENYLKNVVRYIHKNPENAGMKKYYEWSSYNEYITSKNLIVDRKFILNLFENNVKNFEYFHNEYKKDKDLGQNYEMVNKIEDEEAIKIMKEISKEENLIKIQNYEINIKRKLIEKFLKIEGIKKVQIARILGMNRMTINRIARKM